MTIPLTIDGIICDPGDRILYVVPKILIPKPKKKKKQKGWRAYRNSCFKNTEVRTIYVYNGMNEKGHFVLTRIN
jgi:hypothetical protein